MGNIITVNFRQDTLFAVARDDGVFVAVNQFKKHFLGLSDNVTYFAEQLEPADVSTHARNATRNAGG